MGTAWAIELEYGMDEKNLTTLITKDHEIEGCIGGKGKLTVAELFKNEIPAYVIKWDKENDLAVLATGLKLKPLGLSQQSNSIGISQTSENKFKSNIVINAHFYIIRVGNFIPV